MDTIVNEISPATLLAASHEHVTAYALFCGHAPNGEVFDTPELAWAISGNLSPYMNMVVRTRLEPDANVGEMINAVLDRANQRGVPIGWFLLPGSSPADMGAKLLDHDLTYEGDDPGMSIDLQSLPQTLPARGNLQIVEVQDLRSLEQWVETWGESFGASRDERRRRFDFRASLGLDSAMPYRPFLAYLDNQPVGTSELYLGAGVAAVMWVGTIPSARGQGIGASLTLAPLLEARRLGYRIGALTSSRRGYSIYLKLGFREMCRIPVYCWSPVK